VNDIFKTDHFGKGQGLDPDQKDGPSNPHDSSRSSYLKILFLEFHQVFGKYPDLSDIYLEGCGPLFFFGIKFKLIQVEIRLFRHAQNAAVLEFDAQHGISPGLNLVAEMNGNSPADLDRG